MNRRILNHFHVDGKVVYRGGPYQDFLQDVKNAVNDNAMAALIGEVGSGKTTLFRDAALHLSASPDKWPVFIYVRNFYKEHLTIGGIMNAIIMDISDESPRRDLEARSRQVIRLMGEMHVRNKRQVCIVIEEAHRVHINTLRAIKELREAIYANVSPLFSVVLIGHPSLTEKLQARKEVFWRTQAIELSEVNGWMTYDERVSYLKAVYGEALSDKARTRVAMLKKQPLSMDQFIETKMAEAYAAGYKQLDESMIEASLLEMKESLDASLADIAAEAGKGKTTVHQVIIGADRSPANNAAVRRALEKIAERRAREERETLAS